MAAKAKRQNERPRARMGRVYFFMRGSFLEGLTNEFFGPDYGVTFFNHFVFPAHKSFIAVCNGIARGVVNVAGGSTSGQRQ
jgi:hypothetical protein